MLPERAPSEGPRSTGAVRQSYTASLQEWWNGICRARLRRVVDRTLSCSRCRSRHSSLTPDVRLSLVESRRSYPRTLVFSSRRFPEINKGVVCPGPHPVIKGSEICSCVPAPVIPIGTTAVKPCGSTISCSLRWRYEGSSHSCRWKRCLRIYLITPNCLIGKSDRCMNPFDFYGFVGLFGGVGAMRSGGMRRWEGNAWSTESHSDSRAEKALAFLRR